MQDIHSIGGRRLFGGGGGGSGGGGGVDRRLRPHNHHHNLQALKCPRCDSVNTKFCYYNNYNLSQPRHFCKGCRRYWTKGGVLRNVPVGGGCRKTKRSSKPKPNSEATVVASSVDRNKSNSNSSSESSSLTATNAAAATTEEVSAPPCSSSNSILLSVPDLKILKSQNENQNFEFSLLDHGSDCGIFSEIGSFTSLITSTNNQLMFGINNNIQWHNHQEPQQQQQQQEKVSINGDEVKMQEITDAGLLELSGYQNRSSNHVGFGSLDWQGDGDQGMFDLSHTVDHAYWSQNQWTDQDHSHLYLP